MKTMGTITILIIYLSNYNSTLIRCVPIFIQKNFKNIYKLILLSLIESKLNQNKEDFFLLICY